MVKTIVSVFWLSGVAVVALIWAVLYGVPGPPNVSVAFVGYANDGLGHWVAECVVSNLSSTAVILQARGLDVQTAEGSAGWDGYRPEITSVLRAGACETFSFCPPMDQSRWRLRVAVYPDAEPLRTIKRTGADALRRVGFKPAYRDMVYCVCSSWTASEK